MRTLAVLFGFAFVGVALYAALSKKDDAPSSAPLPQPAAPGLNPSV